MVDQAEIHRMASSENVEERKRAVEQLENNFAILEDKNQAWDDLHQLTSDKDRNVRRGAASALGSAFSHVPDKNRAWDDLIQRITDEGSYVSWDVADALDTAFSQVPDKNQAWDDLIRLTSDKDSYVRRSAAYALGSAFSQVPDKNQAWDDLHRLTSDKDSDVRASAYHSLGKASIFKAANAENDIDLKKEMEAAIGYFEKSSQPSSLRSLYLRFLLAAVGYIEKTSQLSIWSRPAKFCIPFYRSFYMLTFQNEETEAEVQKYIAEAKNAVEGSESKEKLLEAVENLGNALKEVRKVRDFSDIKSDLNAYRRYCNRACELLETTDEKAPGASRLIRKGLPIIDERIKGIIAEIQEKAKALCKQVKDTEYKEIGQQVNNVGQELLKVIDPIRLDKEVSRMLIPLSAMCKKMPEEDRGEACEILKQINDEQNVEDKLPLISMFLSKISTQMDQKNVYVNIQKSEHVQVSIGKDNYQVQSSNSQHEKD
ncbi:MAG: HEAT repeat domain-containing protein [Proteobacteria bacterium]|nr:HEAT repeat domain-containing protein [Pseudomonadota bacterium]